MIKLIPDKDDLQALQHVVKRMPKELYEEAGDGLLYIKNKFYKRFRAERLSGPPGVHGRSGKGLFGRFKHWLSRPSSKQGLGLVMYTNSDIAKAHEFGETIRPSDGKYLAVPLSFAKFMFTAKGKLRQRYRNVREIPNAFKAEFKGQPYIARRKTKRSEVVQPLFALKRSIRLKPRLGFYELWDGFENQAYSILAKRVMKGVRKAWEAKTA